MSIILNGTDGGYDYSTASFSNNIGYSDGIPFISANSHIGHLAASRHFEPSKKIVSEEKILGYTYGYMANRGEYRSPQGIKSQDLLYELGNNWVCLAIANYQEHFYSTDIRADYLKTPSVLDIIAFVEKAHNKGIKVCLKPMVNSEDNMWRAHIGFPDLNMSDMDVYWAKWFESYKQYILYYAELAEELGCEMLCIGCEMLGTEHRSYDWLHIIEEVRKVYSGKLIYNTNHDHEDAVEWFDVLDYIGTSAYYPVGQNGVTKEKMIEEWTKIKWRLDAIAEQRRKKYIFMEVGCRSAHGCSVTPWDFTLELPWDEDEQALYYETCMSVFFDDPNFAGIFWWDWPTITYNTYEEAKQDKGFNIHLKKAEQVVKEFYKKYGTGE